MASMKFLPPELIEVNKDMLRSCNKQSEEYQEMLQSIRSKGIIDSLAVKDRGDGKYTIINGYQRLNCALDLGLATVPCNILDIAETDILEAQIVANAQKIETTPVEYTKALLKLLAAKPAMLLSELATRLGKSTSWLNERFSLIKLVPEAQLLVNEGKIVLTSAYALAKCPEDMQRQLMDMAQTAPTQEFVLHANNLLKAHKQAVRAGKPAGEAVFEPNPRLQKMKDLKEALDSKDAKLFNELNSRANVKTAQEGFMLCLSWVLHLDPISIDAAKADFDSRKKKMADEAAARKAEREAKKAAVATPTA